MNTKEQAQQGSLWPLKNGFDLFLWQIIVKWYTLKKSFIAIYLSYKNMASRQTS